MKRNNCSLKLRFFNTKIPAYAGIFVLFACIVIMNWKIKIPRKSHGNPTENYLEIIEKIIQYKQSVNYL